MKYQLIRERLLRSSTPDLHLGQTVLVYLKRKFILGTVTTCGGTSCSCCVLAGVPCAYFVPAEYAVVPLEDIL